MPAALARCPRTWVSLAFAPPPKTRQVRLWLGGRDFSFFFCPTNKKKKKSHLGTSKDPTPLHLVFPCCRSVRYRIWGGPYALAYPRSWEIEYLEISCLRRIALAHVTPPPPRDRSDCLGIACHWIPDREGLARNRGYDFLFWIRAQEVYILSGE